MNRYRKKRSVLYCFLASSYTLMVLVLPPAYAEKTISRQNGDITPALSTPVKTGQINYLLKFDHRIQGMQSAKHHADGRLHVRERISGKGMIESRHVVIEGEISPGNSPGCIDFGGDVTFTSSSLLRMEIAGVTACTQFDRISVTNKLTIDDASLKIELLDGFVPSYQQSFNILNWGQLSGTFANIDDSTAVLPPPLQWDYSQLYLTGEVVVGVTNIADGDLAPYDAPDGIIDAADILIAYQLILDQRLPGALQYAHGDINNDGVINVSDLLLIQKIVLQ